MKIELNGYNIDNLLKTLHIKKVTLFNLIKHNEKSVSFEILDKDYKKVKRYISNFKTKETLSKFKQIPKIIVANVGVLLGCFIGLIFGIFASNYTWQIKVYGTKDLNIDSIISVLNENGISVGNINHQTSEEIENILLNKYDKIAQVSVIKKGTAIIINLSEKLVYNEQIFEPIKAKYSGIIKDINIITGTTNVKVGDYVNAGDVLVLPFNINANGEKVSVCPIAEIKAEIFVVNKCELNKTEQVLIRTGKTITQYKYKLKNKTIFSTKNKNSFALFEVNVYNENISDLLPLNRDVVTYYELKSSTKENNLEDEKDNLINKCVDGAYENLPVGEILNEKTTTAILGEKLIAITTITVFGVIT